MTDRTPNEEEIATMARDVLTLQMAEDPRADTVSSGIILPTLVDHGFSHRHEALLEGPVEDAWGLYLRGEVADPLDAIRMPADTGGWNSVRLAMDAAVIQAVGTLIEEVGTDGEGVYAIAAYTDGDGRTVSIAANTERGRRCAMDADAGDGPPSALDEANLRWSSSEWAMEGRGRHELATTNAMLADVDRRDADAAFEAVIKAMTRSLASARSRFADALKDVTLFVTVTDDDDAEAIENASAALLNPPHLLQEFLSRFDEAASGK